LGGDGSVIKRTDRAISIQLTRCPNTMFFSNILILFVFNPERPLTIISNDPFFLNDLMAYRSLRNQFMPANETL
jgi:hypothetical protein